MKFSFCSFLAFTALASAYAVPRAGLGSRTSIVERSGFSAADGTKFAVDGKSEYYAGTNAYWLPFLTNNADVDLVMGHLQSSGLTVLRVWGFNDVNTAPTDGSVYFHLIKSDGTSTINTGADGLQRLDYVVQSAANHGIKLIINFVNNWSAYGGIAAYNTAFGGSATSWYTDSASQNSYRNYIQAVVSRYSSNSAIFGWELANEPRCHGCDTSVITNWVSSTSAYVKSLDSNHMVGVGDEGMGLATNSDGSYPFGYSEGVDFEKNLAISTIDFGTMHLYPSQWGMQDSWGASWVTAHGAACASANKPCLLEEYGSNSLCKDEQPWQAAAKSTNGISGDLFWQYGDSLSTGQSPNDGYTLYYGSSDFSCMTADH